MSPVEQSYHPGSGRVRSAAARAMRYVGPLRGQQVFLKLSQAVADQSEALCRDGVEAELFAEAVLHAAGATQVPICVDHPLPAFETEIGDGFDIVGILPRLRLFAIIICGDPKQGDLLLERALSNAISNIEKAAAYPSVYFWLIALLRDEFAKSRRPAMQ